MQTPTKQNIFSFDHTLDNKEMDYQQEEALYNKIEKVKNQTSHVVKELNICKGKVNRLLQSFRGIH